MAYDDTWWNNITFTTSVMRLLVFDLTLITERAYHKKIIYRFYGIHIHSPHLTSIHQNGFH